MLTYLHVKEGYEGWKTYVYVRHTCSYIYTYIYVSVVFTGNISVQGPTRQRGVRGLEDICVCTHIHIYS